MKNDQRKSYKAHTGFWMNYRLPAFISSKSNFCENINFDSKFGSLSLGHGWYRAKSTQRNVIHIFHESWSKFKPMKSIDDVHLNYGVIRDIQQRTIIATEHFIFGFYHSKPDRLKIWKISSVFGCKMMQIDASQLQVSPRTS